MRIIIISSAEKECDPETYGGLEIVVYNLADALVNHLESIDWIEEVAVACCQHSRLPKGVTYIPTVEPKEDPHHNWIAEEEAAYNIYEPYLKDFDIICDHSWFGFPYLYKLRHPEVGVCHTFHGMRPWNTNPPISGDPNYIAASSIQADIIYNILGKPVRVLWHGVDTTTYSPMQPQQEQREPEGDYYLFLNRVMREKGAIEFIDVCERAGVRGILAGEDKFVSDQRYVEMVKDRCEQSDYVEYKGTVSLKEKVTLLQNAKALIALPVFPYIEIFGLYCTEALACGTPVIALRNGGLVDQLSVCRGVGILCDTVDEVVIQVRRYDRGFIELSKVACHEQAKLYFSKHAFGLRYCNFFREMIDVSERSLRRRGYD